MDGCEESFIKLTVARFLTTTRPFPHNNPPVSSQQPARFLTIGILKPLKTNTKKDPEFMKFNEVELSAVDGCGKPK
jgi:hypothetical protein